MLFALFPGGGRTPADGSPWQAGRQAKRKPRHIEAGAFFLPITIHALGAERASARVTNLQPLAFS
jgi:hypothetical protein